MPLSSQTCTPLSNYEDVVAYLDALDASVMRFGTTQIERVLAYLGKPQDLVKTIHVVGTNGKGSVSAMLTSVYTQAGYKTGLFISPHLIEVRERIQLDGMPVTKDRFTEAARIIRQASEAVGEPLTYFTFLNAMAFWLFADEGIDIAVIEAGLGGRLDSTNVIHQPRAIAVTSISYDHMDKLGATLTDIAGEKAGVFREGVPVFTVPNQPHEAREVIAGKARQNHAPVFETTVSVETGSLIIEKNQVFRMLRVEGYKEEFQLNLPGRYQSQNAGLVLSVIQGLQATLPTSVEAIQKGLQTVSWPGRLQYLPQHQLVIDGSHNADGFASLLETLALDFPGTPIHWGISLTKNRDIHLLNPLFEYVDTHQITFIQGEPAALFHDFQSFNDEIVNLDAFLNNSSASNNILRVLTGSLYTAGHALSLLP